MLSGITFGEVLWSSWKGHGVYCVGVAPGGEWVTEQATYLHCIKDSPLAVPNPHHPPANLLLFFMFTFLSYERRIPDETV